MKISGRLSRQKKGHEQEVVQNLCKDWEVWLPVEKEIEYFQSGWKSKRKARWGPVVTVRRWGMCVLSIKDEGATVVSMCFQELEHRCSSCFVFLVRPAFLHLSRVSSYIPFPPDIPPVFSRLRYVSHLWAQLKKHKERMSPELPSPLENEGRLLIDSIFQRNGIVPSIFLPFGKKIWICSSSNNQKLRSFFY